MAMTDQEPLWDVVFRAVVHQHTHPAENGAGMIGKAAAVFAALGLNADMTMAEFRRRMGRR